MVNSQVRTESVLGDIVRQVAVVFATISTIVINGLANALPINGQGTGEISDRFQVLFVPAGYVFSIWGIIYLGLIGYTVYQALPDQRVREVHRKIGPAYLVSAAANCMWIFLWHYEQFPLTILVMLALLGCLIAIYAWTVGLARIGAGDRWLVRVPFSIYLGWITVATVANATSLLDYLQWGGWGIPALGWFLVLLVVASLIGAAFGWLRADVAYVAVLVWAFTGIAAKHSDNTTVALASNAAAAVVAIVLVAGWLRLRRATT
jgi:hypothetical protein